MLSDQLFGFSDIGSGRIGGNSWKICSLGVGVRAGGFGKREALGEPNTVWIRVTETKRLGCFSEYVSPPKGLSYGYEEWK